MEGPPSPECAMYIVAQKDSYDIQLLNLLNSSLHAPFTAISELQVLPVSMILVYPDDKDSAL